jgi:RNA polymerase sigma factor (sigma-70 family)
VEDNRTTPTHDELGRLLRRFCLVLRDHANQSVPSVLGSTVDGEDLLQQACSSAIENLFQFTGSTHGEFFLWFRTIYQNTRSNFLREYTTKARDIFREVAAAGHDCRTPLDPATGSWKVMQQEAREALLRAIQDLPEEYYRIVTFRCDGAPFEEIAGILGMSRKRVQRRFLTAVSRLKEKLKPFV